MDSDWFIRIKMDLNRLTLGYITDGFRLVYQNKIDINRFTLARYVTDGFRLIYYNKKNGMDPNGFTAGLDN
jgi:hypothetical protein